MVRTQNGMRSVVSRSLDKLQLGRGFFAEYSRIARMLACAVERSDEARPRRSPVGARRWFPPVDGPPLDDGRCKGWCVRCRAHGTRSGAWLGGAHGGMGTERGAPTVLLSYCFTVCEGAMLWEKRECWRFGGRGPGGSPICQIHNPKPNAPSAP